MTFAAIQISDFIEFFKFIEIFLFVYPLSKNKMACVQETPDQFLKNPKTLLREKHSTVFAKSNHFHKTGKFNKDQTSILSKYIRVSPLYWDE